MTYIQLLFIDHYLEKAGLWWLIKQWHQITVQHHVLQYMTYVGTVTGWMRNINYTKSSSILNKSSFPRTRSPNEISLEICGTWQFRPWLWFSSGCQVSPPACFVLTLSAVYYLSAYHLVWAVWRLPVFMEVDCSYCISWPFSLACPYHHVTVFIYYNLLVCSRLTY